VRGSYTVLGTMPTVVLGRKASACLLLPQTRTPHRRWLAPCRGDDVMSAMAGEDRRRMAVPPQSVGRVLWRAWNRAGTARPHLPRIFIAKKSVVAVAGEPTQCPLCSHSDQSRQRSDGPTGEMPGRLRKSASPRKIGPSHRG